MRAQMKFIIGLSAAVLLSLSSLYVHADQLADVKKAGELVVGTEMQFAPFDYLEDGKQQGFNAELFTLLAERLGVKARFLDLPWASVLPGLDARKFDIVGGPLIVTRARQQRYRFLDPIAEATVVLLRSTRNTKLGRPEDIAGQTVGASKGSAQLDELKSFAATLTPAVTIREYADNNQAYADLAAGRIVAVANSLPNMSYVAAQRPQVFTLVQPPFGQPSYFAYLGRKDADAASLIAELNNGLAVLKADGRLAALQQKWLGVAMQTPQGEFQPSW